MLMLTFYGHVLQGMQAEATRVLDTVLTEAREQAARRGN
jgi:hypothetical protein